jgi:hypothetical protein
MDVAEYPLPHAHIALNRGHLEEILRSVDILSDAIAVAVTMLKEQVLELDWPAAQKKGPTLSTQAAFRWRETNTEAQCGT